MPPLQVKDCPQDVYDRLRVCAKEENRSMAQQTVTILQSYLDMRDRERRGDISTDNENRTRANDNQPSYSWQDEAHHRVSYYNDGGGVDYLSRYKETLKRIDALPPLPISETRPRADILLAQIREEEAR